MADAHAESANVQEELLRLVYELLDAHDDTARLAADRRDDLRWRVHLDYLRDLQRVGRGLLAQATTASDADPDDVALDAARAAVARAMKPHQLTISCEVELPHERR